MSKILEKVVVSQLMSHLKNLFSIFQSAYRPGYSTETALLKVFNDLLLALDEESCQFWYSLTYLQRLIPLTMIYYSTAYSMCSVFKALCYLGSDVISLKDSKLFQLKVLILTKQSCVVVHYVILHYLALVLNTCLTLLMFTPLPDPCALPQSTPNVKLKSYGQRSFAYHGLFTWNSLSLALRYRI